MDDSDIMFIDDDERNAREHRVGGATPARAVPFGSRTGRVVVRSTGRQPVVVRSATPVAVAAQPRLFGNLTAGELVEVGAQILATLQPLPAAPVATGATETDVGNLALYQAALATHAKRDEQLRTLGSLVGKLLG